MGGRRKKKKIRTNGKAFSQTCEKAKKNRRITIAASAVLPNQLKKSQKKKKTEGLQ